MSFLGKLLSGMSGGHHGGGHGGGRHGYRDDAYRNPTPPSVPAPPSGAGISCPACSAPNLQGARFCAQCGKSLIPGNCDSCKASLVAGAKFCPNCGKSQTY